ncbi:hypothetical protein AK812_SmicGene2008 [Symbiodinium microadriaticum]|uniref:Uncharacterized protein n=1 Tax=Symbiodinium microadriaticum TaxID=2951 RepID=A0A1Q9F2P9_SYMMI|nr:hypothetical protein AK812_SmicGene2008 [Symbiodinium microadriaticum]
MQTSFSEPAHRPAGSELGGKAQGKARAHIASRGEMMVEAAPAAPSRNMQMEGIPEGTYKPRPKAEGSSANFMRKARRDCGHVSQEFHKERKATAEGILEATELALSTVQAVAADDATADLDSEAVEAVLGLFQDIRLQTELSFLRQPIFAEDGERTCEVYPGGGDRVDWIDTDQMAQQQRLQKQLALRHTMAAQRNVDGLPELPLAKWEDQPTLAPLGASPYPLALMPAQPVAVSSSPTY